MQKLRLFLFPAFVFLVLLAAGLLPFSLARGQEPLRLDAIVITAPRVETPLSRVPGAVSVIDWEENQRAQQGLALDEPLARVPGMFMQNRYNFAQDLRISIRGFGARAPFGIRGIKILVDGIPATLPDGQASVDAIDLDAIDRFEVLRGAASSLYGNASGGVIDATTGGRAARPSIQTGAATGADGFRKNTFAADGLFGNLGASTNLSHLDFDGFRAHSKTESTRFNARFQYQLGDDADLTLVARAVDSPLAQDPGGLTAAELGVDRRQASPGNLRFDAGEALDEQQLGLVFRRNFGARHELRLRGHTVWRDFANRLPFESGGQVEFDRSVSGAGIMYTLNAAPAGFTNRLLVGVDLERQRDDRQRYDNLDGVHGDRVFDQLEAVSNRGLFVQNEWSATDRLTVTAGVRHDRLRFEVDDRFLQDGVDDSGSRVLSEVSPKIGANYFISPALSPYANVSRSFETPTTTEFARCQGGGFVDSLQAQEFTSYELGAKGQISPNLSYGVAAYHIDGFDEIVSRACPGRPGREFFVNAGRTSRNGFELNLDAAFPSGWNASLAYSFSEFKFERFRTDDRNLDGNVIPGAPRHTLYGELGYHHPTGWFGAMDLLFTGELFVDNENTLRNGASIVTGARAGFERLFGDWGLEAYLGINNFLDERYNGNVRVNAFGGRYFEPAPGRNAYAGLQIRYRFPQSGAG